MIDKLFLPASRQKKTGYGVSIIWTNQINFVADKRPVRIAFALTCNEVIFFPKKHLIAGYSSPFRELTFLTLVSFKIIIINLLGIQCSARTQYKANHVHIYNMRVSTKLNDHLKLNAPTLYEWLTFNAIKLMSFERTWIFTLQSGCT